MPTQGTGPTWTHPWPGVEPRSGSAGTGGDTHAISAPSPRGTPWRPAGRADMGPLWFKPTSLLTPTPNTLGFWTSRGPGAPTSTNAGGLRRGRDPVALQRTFLGLCPSRGLVPRLRSGSVPQVSPDLMLWERRGGERGEDVGQAWSPLTAPGNPVSVTAEGPAPRAQSACQQASQTSNRSRREIQAPSGRGTQWGPHSTLRGRAKASGSPGGQGCCGAHRW